MTVPIVCVVLEGGPGTLETCYRALDNDTPVLVIEVGNNTFTHLAINMHHLYYHHRDTLKLSRWIVQMSQFTD